MLISQEPHRKCIERAYLAYIFFCYSAVYFSLGNKKVIWQWPCQVTFCEAMESSMQPNQYQVCPPFLSRTAALHRIDITKLAIVFCGMFAHSSCTAIHIWSLFVGSGCRRWIAWSRTSQTYFIEDKSGKYAGQSSTWTFASSRSSVQTRATWGLASSCWKMLFWRMKDRTIGRRISSRSLTTFRLPTIKWSCARCPWDIQVSSWCASRSSRVAVVVEHWWGSIHAEGDAQRFAQSISDSLRRNQSHLQWVWLVWSDHGDGESGYNGPGQGSSH